jgi:hypothetical protein
MAFTLHWRLAANHPSYGGRSNDVPAGVEIDIKLAILDIDNRRGTSEKEISRCCGCQLFRGLPNEDLSANRFSLGG